MSGLQVIESLALRTQFARVMRSTARVVGRLFGSDRLTVNTNKMHLALVIPLDEATAHFATKLQIDILRKFGRNPGLDACPHITLKLGFDVSDIAPYEEYLEQLAAGVAPFQVSIKNFGFFDEGIMFLDVEPSPALENLRQRIVAELSEQHGIDGQPIEHGKFRFHVTLAYGLSSREFNQLQKSFSTRKAEFNFEAKHIDLFCHTGQQWVTYKRAMLRSEELDASPGRPISPVREVTA